MSIPFAAFIGVCYLGFTMSCLIEGKYLWSLVGLCWGVGNLAIAVIMLNDG